MRLALIVTLAWVAGCGSSTQEPRAAESVSLLEALPQAEIRTPNDDLRVSIRMSPDAVVLGDAPTIIARFENVGSTDLYLNPHLITGAFLPDRAKPIGCVTQMDYGIRMLSPGDFIRLAPSTSWERQIDPDWGAYGTTRQRFAHEVVPGVHRVSFRYMNYPDCRHIRYDPYRIGIRVWEGQIDAPALSLTIRPLARDSERALIARVRDGRSTDLALLLAQNSAAANDALANLLAQDPTSPWRMATFVRERADCRIWSSFSPLVGHSRNDIEQPLTADLVAAFVARCPAVQIALRAALADESQPPDVRRHAARLLAKLRLRGDVPLLVAALRSRPADDPARSHRAREGAALALGEIGGDQARTALIEALQDPAHTRIHDSIANALGQVGGPGAAAALIGQLSSSDSSLVLRVILSLRQLSAKSATPDLVRLLKHRNTTIRIYAASALDAIADGGIQAEMKAALADSDANVQMSALFYLAKHGNASLAPLFEERAGAPHQYVREAARRGLNNLGTASSVQKIRPLLASESRAVRLSTVPVLEQLTFRPWQPRDGTEMRLADFDAWWRIEGGKSRRDWAVEALERPSTASPMAWSPDRTAKVSALAYLDRQRDPAFAPIFLAQTRDEDWAVRIRAVEALGRFDRLAAVRLLIREFDGRYVAACTTANEALERLTGERVPVDCESPDSRGDARARWRAIADAPPS
jgi:HEAT repeat protein